MKTTQQAQAKASKFTPKNLLAITGVLLRLATVSPAAAVQCGDTIGPNVTVALSGTITCDNTSSSNVGLKIIGPGEVDLTDLVINCKDANQDGIVPPGLVILGEKAKVRGGVVSGCSYGVYVTGAGRHTVENVQVTFSRLHTFYITSSKNTLRRNLARGGFYAGFVTEEQSHHNTLIENYVPYQLQDGFLIRGIKHKLRQNYTEANGGDGYSIQGRGHELTENVANRNVFDGFDLQEGSTKKVTLYKNQALYNGQDGFQISGQHHKLIENQAQLNTTDGIQVHEASHIKLMNNEARYNNRGEYSGIFDLKDLTSNCGTNTWKNNTFDTANQLCIQ